MAIGLVPYQWKTDGEMPFWALPDGVTSAIDLRRRCGAPVFSESRE